MGTGEERDRQATLTQALLEAVRARYAGRFNDEELAKIQDDIQKLGDASAELRAYPLTNADEPDFVFRAYRREG